VFFFNNYEGLRSEISVLYSDSKEMSKETESVLRQDRQFNAPQSLELESFDGLTRVELGDLTARLQGKLGVRTSDVCRKLFQDAGAALPHNSIPKIIPGSILAVKKITVLIPLE
jgi:hypothetical protein